jgi:hypothetical protein
MTNNNKKARIISDIPGRMRIRFHKKDLPKETLRAMVDHLGTHEGITHVDTNNTTGSVTIKYGDSKSREQIIGILKDAGVIAYKTASILGETLPPAPPSTTSMSIMSAIDDIDRRLSKITGANIDLKILFPFTLTALGLRQLFMYGLGLPQIPAYVLLWYAFDSFWKFHSKGTTGQQL